MYKKVKFGELSDGRNVTQYTLVNKNGLSASFLDLGGIWSSMLVPGRDGELADVVLGYDTIEACLGNGGHLGEIVGRNANRIGKAEFTLNGVTYKLEANNGPNNLHSGPDFYRNRIWDTEVTEEEDGTSITFSLLSPDGDQGYPGNARISVVYTLTEENELKIRYHMVCDQDTVANMTNHSYFNLAGHRSGSAMDQLVWIDADRYTPTDDVAIPYGELRPVAGSPMDFTVKKPIGRDIDADCEQIRFGHGYDHNWVLNHEPGKLSLSAKAWDEKSGRTMEVYTDLPGIQFYTANYLEPDIPGKEGVLYGPRQGYCFETQYYPNAVNMPDYPSPVLKEGKEYSTTTIYKFMIE
ncbi:aldose epimerase family protein [uncultured Clostridium sp.]|uniref:aldose epimerase family protein n=1 Tax=uncultured Clostridium sp. TaxID=59620 RepID=UPI0025D2E98E|nr:aldose epimerase family protein [uncultured Clostridium sp.]